MSTPCKIKGRQKGDVFIDQGDIRLMIAGGSISIGELTSLYELEPYQDGEYKTENGLLVNVERFIDNMVVGENMLWDIKRAPKNNVNVDEGVSQRLHRFHNVLLKRLRGEIQPR